MAGFAAGIIGIARDASALARAAAIVSFVAGALAMAAFFEWSKRHPVRDETRVLAISTWLIVFGGATIPFCYSFRRLGNLVS